MPCDRVRRGWPAVLFAAGAISVASCSTVTRPVDALGQVQPTSSASQAATSGGSVAPGTSAPRGPGRGTSGTSTGISGSTTGTSGASGAVTSGGSATAGGASSGGTSAAATCTKVLKIGVSYSSDFGAAVAAATGGSQSAGSNYSESLKKMYSIGIEDLNRRGGLGGCKTQLALHDFKVAAADGFDGQSQQECADFGDDQKVFAVYPAWFESKVLVSCLAKRKVPVLPGPAISFFPTKADYAQFRGTLYGPTNVAVDRLGPVMDMFAAKGFFGPGAKVGFLVDDDSDGTNRRLVAKLWKPRLAALGVPVVSTFTYPHQNGTSGSGDAAAAMSSAVVQFQRAGVTHVIPTPDDGAGVQYFTPVAHSQGYHPRLGVVSTSGAEMLNVTNGPVPAESKPGAMAVSWTLYDFAGDATGGWVRNPSNAARDRCLLLYKKEAAANNIAMPSLFPWCDTLNLLQLALAGSTGVPTSATLLAGVEGLGRTFQNVTGYGPAVLGSGRYDGGAKVRVMSWNSSAKNWDYISAPLALP